MAEIHLFEISSLKKGLLRRVGLSPFIPDRHSFPEDLSVLISFLHQSSLRQSPDEKKALPHP
jgi:hypothetical protein